MTAATRPRASLGGLPEAYMNLLRAEMRVGSELFQSLTGQPLPSMADLARELGLPRMGRRAGGCCTIPEPCWMPRDLGRCVSHVGSCSSACIELDIVNCDREERTVTVEATGGGAQKVTVDPPSVRLGPKEHATVRVCVKTGESPAAERIESILWVRGCREHYLRWDVRVGSFGLDSCHRIEVDDCPDYLHHWYDHFYCRRGCGSHD